MVLKTGVTPPPPPPTPAYEPVKKIVQKPKKKIEWAEKCRITFTKSDILMLTILHGSSPKVMAYKPIILDPETIVFTYYIPKKKPLSATRALLKTLAFSKISHGVKHLPIRLNLDPKTAALLPPIDPKDQFILTVITESKKGNTIKSHFVDSITTDGKSHY